jgi:hypothetical protein
MRIMFISPKADATTDIHNPDATLRARSLCALELGSRHARVRRNNLRPKVGKYLSRPDGCGR